MTSNVPPPYPGENNPTNGLPSYGSVAPPGGSYPPPPSGGYQPQAPSGVPETNKTALWSMIAGIASIPLLCLCGIGFFGGITALALGIVSKGQIKKSQGMQTGNGQALAGIILGAVAIALTIIYVIGIFALGFAGSFPSSDYSNY
ncbi:MAG: DUF4190 domain-containing protein [Aeromicrobium sp.]